MRILEVTPCSTRKRLIMAGPYDEDDEDNEKK
jgi:hypothetical protein